MLGLAPARILDITFGESAGGFLRLDNGYPCGKDPPGGLIAWISDIDSYLADIWGILGLSIHFAGYLIS